MNQKEIQEFETAKLKRALTLITILKLQPIKEGNQWSFLFGEDLQTGISGFGDTVYDAMLNFEYEFCTRKAMNMKRSK